MFWTGSGKGGKKRRPRAEAVRFELLFLSQPELGRKLKNFGRSQGLSRGLRSLDLPLRIGEATLGGLALRGLDQRPRYGGVRPRRARKQRDELGA